MNIKAVLRHFTTLILCAIILNLWIFFIFYLSRQFGLKTNFVFAIVFLFAGIVAGGFLYLVFRKFEFILLAALLSIASLFLYGADLPSYEYLLKGRSVKNISMAELEEQKNATKYIFTDGIALTDLIGYALSTGPDTGSESHYFIAPLAIDAKEVGKSRFSAFLTYKPNSANRPIDNDVRDIFSVFNKYHAAVKEITLSGKDNDYYTEAIQDANEKYQIQGEDKTPILLRVINDPNPDNWLENKIKSIKKWSVLGFNACFLTFYLIIAIIQTKKQRPNNPTN